MTTQTIERFYDAFSRKDAEGMAACYHPDVHFSDPVFTDLNGEHAKNMWRMLCARGKDLRIEYRVVSANDSTGTAHWEAWYTFSTGKKVHNVIDATFMFSDGLIIQHRDEFNLKAWAGQALGLPGKLLGGTSFMQNKIRTTAMRGLEAFEASR